MNRFFSYDHMGGGMSFHDTADEAMKAAAEAMALYQEDPSCEVWNANVEGVCWGEVRQTAAPQDVPAEAGAMFEGEPVTHWTTYALTDTAAVLKG